MNLVAKGSSQGNSGTARAATVAGAGAKLFAGWQIALAVAGGMLALLLFTGLFVASSSAGGEGGGTVCTLQGGGNQEIPAVYIPLLEKAAAKYELGPRGFSIVAAIHYIESDFGQSKLPGVSSGSNEAGAEGPGQFLASSWEAYGVDGDENGTKDPYSIPDSVFATAHYLHVSGAPRNWWNAIFAYNHADWYVEEVLAAAAKFNAGVVCHSAPLGAAPTGDSLQKIEYYARWIERKQISYCWGGGHGLKPGPDGGEKGCSPAGLDCSGSVRWLFVLAGIGDPGGIPSGLFPLHYRSGPGLHVTIWSNPAHVFVSINGRTWGTSESNTGGGPGYAEHTTEGFTASHPPGL
jgi:hypothetical protein